MSAPNQRPFTVEQVAQHWGCSDNHVRNLIHRGELKAFRLGRRMFRISPDAIGEYEQCQLQKSIELDGSTEDSASPGGPMGSGDVIVLMHSRERKPRAKPPTESAPSGPNQQGQP